MKKAFSNQLSACQLLLYYQCLVVKEKGLVSARALPERSLTPVVTFAVYLVPEARIALGFKTASLEVALLLTAADTAVRVPPEFLKRSKVLELRMAIAAVAPDQVVWHASPTAAKVRETDVRGVSKMGGGRPRGAEHTDDCERLRPSPGQSRRRS